MVLFFDLCQLASNQVFYFFKWLGNIMIPVFDFFRKTNVVFKFVPEMPDRGGNGPSGSISEWANRISFNFSLDVPKQIDIFFTAMAGFNSV